jgi:serine/arginine repetitive matrix protein 2
MIKAQQGLLERQSLEDSCFVVDSEDTSGCKSQCCVAAIDPDEFVVCMPVFTRPLPVQSRSSTCTSSSGAGTPPLSSSNGSSISEGSQSSIDLSQIDIALANATHPQSNTESSRARVRARGKGHRRRYSKTHVSRSSVYETIDEEVGPSPSKSVASKKGDTTRRQPIFIVDLDTVSTHSKGEESVWGDERGIVALRKFYALRDEAENVTESRKIWMDTPFSIFALQCKSYFRRCRFFQLMMHCPAFQPSSPCRNAYSS